MNIKKATVKDIDMLIELRLEYLKADRGDMTYEEVSAVTSQLGTYFKRHIGEDFVAYFAEIDNKIVSTAYLSISEKPANPSFITGKTGTLLNVYTYPEYRKMGIATKVINRIIEDAKENNLSYIELSATEDGKPVYKKLGFKEATSKYTQMKLQLV